MEAGASSPNHHLLCSRSTIGSNSRQSHCAEGEEVDQNEVLELEKQRTIRREAETFYGLPLEFKYKQQEEGSNRYLISKFFNFQMVDEKPILEQVHELQILVNKLTLLSIPILEILQVCALRIHQSTSIVATNLVVERVMVVDEVHISVVYVLTTPIPEDDENATVEQIIKRAKWDNDDYVCRGLILNSMSDPLFDIYQNVESSKEL
ncbi:hypothetical protein Tco_0908919 [Tanacetum coccineum]|uniref:Uncharacterized protein n=1 Tax=Tanacetum coccineum TaxID=301880 RepID=A0ABQ5CV19_9ASTR